MIQFFAEEILPFLKIPGKVIEEALVITDKSNIPNEEDKDKIEAMIYAMADKF